MRRVESAAQTTVGPRRLVRFYDGDHEVGYCIKDHGGWCVRYGDRMICNRDTAHGNWRTLNQVESFLGGLHSVLGGTGVSIR